MDPTKWIQQAFLESQVPTTAPDDVAEEPTAGYLMTDVGTGIRVREATEKDAPELAAIAARAFHHAHFEILDLSSLAGAAGRFDLKTLKREIREASSHCLVAIWESNPVGFAHLRPSTASPSLGESPALELHGLYVSPDWTRHGVGTTLARGAVTLARALGFESLWCGVVEANRGAVRFLRAAGFRIVRRERAAIGGKSGVRVLILSRQVSAAI
jgi:ribosomal protein S18 acetylase RimI-like enzyme